NEAPRIPIHHDPEGIGQAGREIAQVQVAYVGRPGIHWDCMGTVEMTAELGSQLCHAIEQFPGVVPRAAHVHVLPLWSQILYSLRRAGLKTPTCQDHGAGVDIYQAVRGLRPDSLDAPLGCGQEIRYQSVIDYSNAPPFGSTEQALRQARATVPELDHGASRKVNATAMAHGRLVHR